MKSKDLKKYPTKQTDLSVRSKKQSSTNNIQ